MVISTADIILWVRHHKNDFRKQFRRSNWVPKKMFLWDLGLATTKSFLQKDFVDSFLQGGQGLSEGGGGCIKEPECLMTLR